MERIELHIKEEKVIKAAQKGADSFLSIFVDNIQYAIGKELSAEAFSQLNSSQITLWGFSILHKEIMDGGFVQLIYNGYGPFLFENPFAKAMRLWDLKDLSKLIYKAKIIYDRNKDKLTKEMSDKEFMALYEQHENFDELDDEFITNEEDYINRISHYIDKHIEEFAYIDKD